MLNWLKKHFIPHEGNDHQPHFLRTKNVRYLVAIVFLFEVAVLAVPFVPILNLTSNSYLASVLPAVLDDLTNQNRQSQHLAVLTVNPVLNEVAQLKANDMAEKGYFAHTSPEGNAPWYWFKQVGYKYEYAGENLAVDFTDSQDVDRAWMNSPTHRANILKNSYTEMGTAVATGTYEGKPTIFVAQEFGKPANTDIKTDFVQVVSSEATTTATVMGASVQVIPDVKYVKPNFFDKYLTSPRHMINIALGIIAWLVFIALLLKLFIKTDKKHPILITNGLIVLALIFGGYVANNYIVKSKLNSTSTFASFSGEEFDQNK
ncbi:MAG: CAP domain-containing protein [Candidatus Paceibacterota bacterium]|jgi:hypothetical protein